MMSGAQFHMEMKLDGAYTALFKNLANNKIPMNMAMDLTDMISETLLKEVNEARNETRRIEAVLNRLEVNIKQLKSMGPVGMAIKNPALEGLRQDTKALSGWMYSLYETYISFFDIFNPQIAREANNLFSQKMQKQLDSEKMKAVVNRYAALLNGGR